MAAIKQDPLDQLQAMFNEILVQTGKAVLASRKDVPTSLSSGIAVNRKISDSLTTYHFALDDLESEITRAKAVLLRDLDKLQEAKRPAPVPEPEPEPVAPPAPMVVEPKQPTAMMMNMPSTAAHTLNANTGFRPDADSPRAAPFPDMGGGMSSSTVDLTSSNKLPTPSPRTAPGTLATGSQPSPQPKPSPKPTPPMKVTPIPPPQIPTAIRAPTPLQPPPAAQATQDTSMDDMLSLSPTVAAGGTAATADMTGGELSFTNMQFSLAPSSDEPSQTAPQAPMQDFDLSSFTQDTGGNDLLSLDNFSTLGGDTSNNTADSGVVIPVTTQGDNTAETTTDNIFELGNGSGLDNMDLDLNLGAGGGGESNFDELFFDNNDSMDQFDDAFFGL